MKKNQPYIIVRDKKKPKHKLVKALHEHGVKNFMLIYASHMATDAGWTFIPDEDCEIRLSDSWLGYTISESIKNIKRMKIVKVGKREYLSF